MTKTITNPDSFSQARAEAGVPPGGFPQANPDGKRAPLHARAASRPSPEAAREMSAYAEKNYSESCLQAGRRQGKADTPLRRGKASDLKDDPQPSDSAQFESFDPII